MVLLDKQSCKKETRKVTQISKQKTQLTVYQLAGNYIRDLDRIQTCNLLSRNQVRYSVAPRGLLIGMQIYYIN